MYKSSNIIPLTDSRYLIYFPTKFLYAIIVSPITATYPSSLTNPEFLIYILFRRPEKSRISVANEVGFMKK